MTKVFNNRSCYFTTIFRTEPICEFFLNYINIVISADVPSQTVKITSQYFFQLESIQDLTQKDKNAQ